MNIIQEFYKQLEEHNIVVVNIPILIIPGEEIIAKYKGKNLEQLNFSCLPKGPNALDGFKFNFGPSITNDEYTIKSLESCLSECCKVIYNKLGNKIFFAELVLPKGTKIAQNIFDRDGIIMRFIEDYYMPTDGDIWRWDILVGKAN